MKRPAFQFYPADWRKDSALKSCSIAARGLWIDLICIMHECAPYGTLEINGRPMQTIQIARLVGESESVINGLLDELEMADVFSRDSNGSIFSRRMRKDEHLRTIRADSGRLGGNPNLVNHLVNQNASKTQANANQSANQNLTPSSSSSSSFSKETPKDNKRHSLATPDGVSESVWADFLSHRKAKRAAVTKTAIDGIVREANKAGITLQAALEIICQRGWSGFRAEWIAKEYPNRFDPVSYVNSTGNINIIEIDTEDAPS